MANNFSWAAVGRLMGRHNEDCRHTYGRMEAKVTYGRFTPEEDKDLTKAVRKVLKLPRDTPIEDMPTKGKSFY